MGLECSNTLLHGINLAILSFLSRKKKTSLVCFKMARWFFFFPLLSSRVREGNTPTQCSLYWIDLKHFLSLRYTLFWARFKVRRSSYFSTTSCGQGKDALPDGVFPLPSLVILLWVCFRERKSIIYPLAANSILHRYGKGDIPTLGYSLYFYRISIE